MTGTKKTFSAGGIVLNPKGKVLLVEQRGNSWSLPKGHIEPNESAFESARREILEESGVRKLDLIKELGTYKRYKIGLHGGEDKTELKEIYMFLFQTSEEKLKPSDKHTTNAKWVAPEEVARILTHKKDKAFFKKWSKRPAIQHQ